MSYFNTLNKSSTPGEKINITRRRISDEGIVKNLEDEYTFRSWDDVDINFTVGSDVLKSRHFLQTDVDCNSPDDLDKNGMVTIPASIDPPFHF